MRKSVYFGVGAVALVAVATLGIKTAMFTPDGVADSRDIKVAAIPTADIQGAAIRLGEAIRFQTISHQDPAENQPAEWTKLHAWLESRYPASHTAMTKKLLPGGTLMYQWPGSDLAAKPIILMAHQDVVPVTSGTEKDWKHAPFSGIVADGAVWGRGAVDDKGALITLFEGVEMLARSGFKPKRSVWIIAGDDEEVGGDGAKQAAAELARLGVKALLTIDEGSAVITDAPIVNGPAMLIGVGEKGFATLKVTAKAVGGHSSMPPSEIGTVNLAKAILAIHKAQFPLDIRPPVSGMLGTLAAKAGGGAKIMVANQWAFGGYLKRKFAGSPAGAAMLHTTIAPTMLQGSPKENVLPQAAFALVNFRIAPGHSSADVLTHVKNVTQGLGLDYAWVNPPREPTPVSSAQSLGWKFIQAAALPDAPGVPVAPYLVVGGTDSRNFYGVSDDVYRFTAARLSTKDTAMIHGTNEHVSLENLGRMIRFYARLIATAAG